MDPACDFFGMFLPVEAKLKYIFRASVAYGSTWPSIMTLVRVVRSSLVVYSSLPRIVTFMFSGFKNNPFALAQFATACASIETRAMACSMFVGKKWL